MLFALLSSFLLGASVLVLGAATEAQPEHQLRVYGLSNSGVTVPYTPTPTAVPTPTQVPTPASGVDRWRPLVASYFPEWAVDEAMVLIFIESTGNPSAVNSSSGACGLLQLHPCPAGGLDPDTNMRLAYAKWASCGGGSFVCDWWNWH